VQGRTANGRPHELALPQLPIQRPTKGFCQGLAETGCLLRWAARLSEGGRNCDSSLVLTVATCQAEARGDMWLS
jgi:hypothetical protein